MNAISPRIEECRPPPVVRQSDHTAIAAASDNAIGFRVCVHRGTRQIGGTCVELEWRGARILLDLGLPLDADLSADDPVGLVPDVPGLRSPDPRLLALVISHGHMDHWGLVPHAHPSLPIVMGGATRRILRAAAPFVPNPASFATDDANVYELADRVPLQIGPFTVTPFLVDHSAYDAYAMLIEAGGRRLFYSGDIRAHGRKAALFERLVSHPPRPIHAMLMEGSSLGRLRPNQHFPTEKEIEQRLIGAFRTPGFVGVCASAQNIDRMVSIYRACKQTGRTLVLDLYALEVLAATDNPKIPVAGRPNTTVYVPEYQRRHIKRTERFDIVDRYKAHRIYREHLAGLAPRAVMLFRPAMVEDIDKTSGAWDGARMIWSQWEGYLPSPANVKFQAKLEARGVGLEMIHTSGHASIADLKRLAVALAPDVLVPVHTFEGDRYPELFGSNVRRRGDGEWWEV
ncbi:MAG TPA: MBL fold metallo-hydrolase [Acetobacteraceae bacterium]|nr:MBL fold metallo-hydrolase [Acetobacteraceae bacterium]